MAKQVITKKSLIATRDYFAKISAEMKKKLESKTKKQGIVQNHHIIYAASEHPEQEVVVRVRKCEHLLLTRLNWYCRKTVSKGFVKAIKTWLAINEDRAEEIE